MITLIYMVEPEKELAEREWLKGLRIYPSSQKYYDPAHDYKLMTRFAVIVSPDAAVTIKLRHPLQFQGEYKRR